MSQAFIPAAFWRGGSSKGLFFHAADLPADPRTRDAVLLAALGSPDPNGRQLDGMGGGISSLSKAVIIGPPTRPDADVDYTFAQVAVDRPVVDWSANCGNLSAAVGPFAIDDGLVAAAEGETVVRIHQVNTRKLMHARVPVRDGRAAVEGGFAIAGVSGTGARIELAILDPGGTATGGLLPTGAVVDDVAVDGRPVAMSLVDACNPVAFVAAADVGLDGTETPDAVEARPELMARLDGLRRAAGVRMGLAGSAAEVPLAGPKIALVSAPAPFRALDGSEIALGAFDVGIRMISMERAHRAVTLTGAMCAGVACRIAGTIPHRLSGGTAPAHGIRIGNPSGVVAVSADVRHGEGWAVVSAGVFRTARCLMRGAVAVPRHLLPRADGAAAA